MVAATVLITGNTYPVKDALKAMGARWDADVRGWRVPADKASAARALVSGSGSKSNSGGTVASSRARTSGSSGYSRGRRTGCSCGSIEDQPRASDCWQCRHDNE